MKKEKNDLTISDKISLVIAEGFGLGRSPFAPGTVGSIWGCVIVALLTFANTPLWFQIFISIFLSILCVPICTVGERASGKKDPGSVVADEYLTFPICMLGLYDKWLEYWWLMPMCFVVARVMDIVKPFPAYRLQDLDSGLGITIDDVVASIYALIANHILFQILVRVI